MSDPCLFQATIIKHGEDIAKQGQAVESMADDMRKVANNVEIIATRLTSMRGFVAGAAAAGGAFVGFVVWIIKSLPAAAAMVVR